MGFIGPLQIMRAGFWADGTGSAQGMVLRNSIHTTMQMTRQMKPLRVGFVPLIDAAPLIMARELGLYERYGIQVHLSREIGWATIRDKIIFGQLEAAHALAAMPFAATIGQSCVACDCLTGLVLNLNGNAITLSNSLRERGVRDANSLRQIIELNRHDKRFTFGVVFPSSSHHYLLREWLRRGGIHPDADVNIVIVPAPSMFENLRNGHLDGYCVGEPWNTVAVRKNMGGVAATSLDLAPGHAEKVLMVRKDFGEQHPDEHLRLIAAIYEACVWCDAAGNREELARVLSRRTYLNVPFETLRESLSESLSFGPGQSEALSDFHVFHRYDANAPTLMKAAWVTNNLLRLGQPDRATAASPATLPKVFREDIYQAALRLVESRPVANNQPETESETVLCK